MTTTTTYTVTHPVTNKLEGYVWREPAGWFAAKSDGKGPTNIVGPYATRNTAAHSGGLDITSWRGGR